MRGATRITKVAELALIGSMILAACVAPAGAVSQGTEDHSQDQAERTRSAVGPAAGADTSYDRVERVRGSVRLAAGADTSYDQVERVRGSVRLAVGADTSYDQAERTRGADFGQ